MSQICYDEISLEHLVQSAELIALVRFADPLSSTEEIAIQAPPPDPNEPSFANPGEPIPPFAKVTLHYQVEEVLLNESNQPCAPGQAIDVLRANWRDELGAHINYYVRGLSESPIYMQYTGSHDGREIPFIVFLVRERGQWRFALDGAVESPARRDAVAQAILGRLPALQPSPEPAKAKRLGFWSRLFGRKG